MLADGAVGREGFLSNAEQLLLDSIGVAYHAAIKHRRCTGDFGDALGNISGGTGLRRRNVQFFCNQRFDNRLLDAVHVYAVDVRTQTGTDFLQNGGDQPLRFVGVVGPHRHPQKRLALLGVGCDGRVTPLQKVGDRFRHSALADAHRAHGMRNNHAAGFL